MALGIELGVLAAYGGAMTAGLLHGLEPGHGWPLTVRAAAKHPHPTKFAVKASLVLASGHFISTLVVVLLFFVVARLLGLLERPLYLIGGSLLLAVAVYPYVGRVARTLRKKKNPIGSESSDRTHQIQGRIEHDRNSEASHPKEDRNDGDPGPAVLVHGGHDHPHSTENPTTPAPTSLRTIFVSALVLGFVHEEEFALIGFVAAGANALAVGVLYGLCVTASIVGVTWTAIRLTARKGGEMDQSRLAILGHLSSAVMLVIGSYYLARGAGIVG